MSDRDEIDAAWADHSLRSEVLRLREERDKAQANYKFMVDRAADEKLEGYRELAQKVADREAEIERLRAELEAYRKIARNSNGVAGWHLNGDIATWEELGIER